MVETITDERVVSKVGENKIEFKHENVQIYTEEQARNVYVTMLFEKQEKEKMIEKFSQLKKEGQEALEKQLTQMMESIRAKHPKTDMVKLKHWKDIQMIQNESQLSSNLKKLKEDITNLKEGLQIWDVCKDLPETKHEKKLKETHSQ